MVLPTGENAVSFSQLRDEFGTAGTDSATAPVRLGQYRRDDPSFTNKDVGELTNLPLDNGVPQTGAISFSDFYSKRLNIVVNYHSGGTEYQQDARDQYDANEFLECIKFLIKSSPSS